MQDFLLHMEDRLRSLSQRVHFLCVSGMTRVYQDYGKGIVVNQIINFQLLMLYTTHSWISIGDVRNMGGTRCSTRYKVWFYGLGSSEPSPCSGSFCDPTPKPPIVGQKRHRRGHLILPESHGERRSTLRQRSSKGAIYPMV